MARVGIGNKSNVRERTWYAYTGLLYCALQTLHFLQIEGLWQPCIEEVYQHDFSNSICSFHVCVSHFGDSCNISDFFIITVFVVIICDQ